jgi:serine/threonine-protein phosphatase PGAM5
MTYRLEISKECRMIKQCSLWTLLALIAIAPTGQSLAAASASAGFTRTLYLIRHGAYSPDPKADPALGPSLNSLGIAQARLVGARLRGMPVQFNSITSSAMTRARETAAVIHEVLPDAPLTQNPLLSECGPQARQARTPTPTEANLQCQRRIDEAFAGYFVPASKADERNVIVAHGNVIRYMVTKALGVDTRSWSSMSIVHASVTMILVHPDGSMSVVAVGDMGHLPPNMQSWGGDDDPLLVTPQLSAP